MIDWIVGLSLTIGSKSDFHSCQTEFGRGLDRAILFTNTFEGKNTVDKLYCVLSEVMSCTDLGLSALYIIIILFHNTYVRHFMNLSYKYI
jgi:hypothetical protein